MENTDLSFYIHKLSNHTDRIFHAIYDRKELNECSLTSLFVLDFLYAHRDQRLCQRDIEDEFFINRATASKMLRLMEEKQLIRRTVSDEDKRSKTIELLEKGWSSSANAAPFGREPRRRWARRSRPAKSNSLRPSVGKCSRIWNNRMREKFCLNRLLAY